MSIAQFLTKALIRMLPTFKNIAVDFTDIVADSFQMAKLLITHNTETDTAG